jgi:hypothetical protein
VGGSILVPELLARYFAKVLMGRAITIAIQREGVGASGSRSDGASGSRSDGASGSRSDEQSARRRTSIMNWSKKLSLYTSLVAKGSTFSAAGPLDDEGGEAEDLVRVCGRALEGIEPLALPEPGIRPDESRSICIYSADAKRPVCGCVGLWSRAVDEKGAKNLFVVPTSEAIQFNLTHPISAQCSASGILPRVPTRCIPYHT